MDGVFEDEIIATGEFSEKFQVQYVLFDDGDSTNSKTAFFDVGKSGWQFGGKISLLDESGNEYTIVVNRLNRMVELYEGDYEIVQTRTPEEMGF
jgi:hypothetical protein